jgi:hypothetical protein
VIPEYDKVSLEKRQKLPQRESNSDVSVSDLSVPSLFTAKVLTTHENCGYKSLDEFKSCSVLSLTSQLSVSLNQEAQTVTKRPIAKQSGAFSFLNTVTCKL